MDRRSFLVGLGGAVFREGKGGLGRIAYIQGEGLWTRSLPNGKAESVVSGMPLRLPRFSPSGKWISYFQSDVLRVVSLESAEKIEVGKLEAGAVATGAKWSPQRDELVLGSAGGLKVFSAANGWKEATRQVERGRFPIVFHPGGNEIAYGDEGRLCRVALDKADSKPRILVSDRRRERFRVFGAGMATFFSGGSGFSRLL